MAQKSLQDLNDFSRGLNTDASPLAYPVGSARELENFVLSSDGSLAKRLGTGVVSGSINSLNADYTTLKTSSYRYTHNNEPYTVVAAAGYPGVGFWELNLIVYDKTWAVVNTDTKFLTQANSVSDAASVLLTSVSGMAVVAFGKEAYVLEEPTGSFLAYLPKIRDLQGVGTRRTTPLTVGSSQQVVTEHAYNLFNEGWPVDALATYIDTNSVYPPNTYVWYAGKVNTKDAFSVTDIDNVGFGETLAPNGYEIIDLRGRGLSRQIDFSNYATALEAATTTVLNLDPTLLADDQTDIIYTGLTSWQNRLVLTAATLTLTDPETNILALDSCVFFSQIASDNTKEKLEKLYSVQDPTAEFLKDPLAEDGGYLVLSELGRVNQLVSTRDALFVMADNGVFSVIGGDGKLFTSINFYIDKVTSSPALTTKGAVVVQDIVLCPTQSGIYRIAPAENSLKFTAVDISAKVVGNLYNSLDWGPLTDVLYDEVSRTARWLFPSLFGGAFSVSRELVLSLDLGAYSTNTYNSSSGFSSYVPLVDPVYSSKISDAIVPDRERGSTNTGFIAISGNQSPDRLAVHTFDATLDFVDVGSLGGTQPFVCKWASGEYTLGDAVSRKTATYFVTHMRRTETGFTDDGSGNPEDPINTSSCSVTGFWDFSDDTEFGKAIPEQEAYKQLRMFFPEDLTSVYGQFMITNKHKIRGRGRALQLILENNDSDKDCIIYGFSILSERGAV